MESTNADAADLELILRPASAGISGPLTAGEIVSRFVESHDLMPGRARAVSAATAYRCYLEWHEKALPAWPAVREKSFAYRMGRLGFKARRPRGPARIRKYGMTLASAEWSRRWEKTHPAPYGWLEKWNNTVLSHRKPTQGEGP